MSAVNRSSARGTLRNVRGIPFTDEVTLKFRNQQLSSENRLKTVGACEWNQVSFDGLAAVPFGLYSVDITPRKYRYKAVNLTVPAGGPGQIDEIFFVDPATATPRFPAFAELQDETQWPRLARVLSISQIADEPSWAKQSNLQKACLLNLYAKMQDVKPGGRAIFEFVQSITEIRQERIFARVDGPVLELIRNAPAQFHTVNGAMHEFESGWTAVDPNGSFKTFEKVGNLQLTFAQNADGDLLADVDIDDHQGLGHVFDVLGHKISGKETHPYDIHEILWLFQGIETGYDFA